MLSKILLFFLTVQAPAVFVEPARIEKIYLKGYTYTEVLKVESKNYPTHIEIYVEDFIINEKGKAEFNKKLKGYSLKNFIKISPRTFDLQPNEVKEVRISFFIPDTVKAFEKWCMIIIRSYPLRKGKPTIRVVGELGVPIYALLSQNISKELIFTNLDFAENKIIFILKNKSPVHVRTHGEIKLLKDGETVYKKSFFNFVIMPLKQRIFEFKIDKNLSKGKYLIQCEIDYGAEEILRAEKEIIIK